MMLQATRKDKGIGVMNQISHGYMFESPNQNQNDRGPSLFEEAKLESKYQEQTYIDDDDGMPVNLGNASYGVYGVNRPMGIKNLNFFKD